MALDEHEPKIELKVLISGERYNMVPEDAEAKLKVQQNMSEVIQSYEDFLREVEADGAYEVDNGFLKLSMQGRSAHGSTPEVGVNAGLILIRFLNGLALDNNAAAFTEFAMERLVGSTDGSLLGMDFSHPEMGETSVNVGMINYTEVDGGIFGVNLRYPKGLDFESGMTGLKEEVYGQGFTVEDLDYQPPHYVDREDPLVDILTDAYRNHVEDDTEPFTIGGGTYARTLKKGVAFGAMFKDTVDTMHQKNERMKIDELLMATEIYLEALHRICIKGEMDEDKLL